MSHAGCSGNSAAPRPSRVLAGFSWTLRRDSHGPSLTPFTPHQLLQHLVSPGPPARPPARSTFSLEAECEPIGSESWGGRDVWREAGRAPRNWHKGESWLVCASYTAICFKCIKCLWKTSQDSDNTCLIPGRSLTLRKESGL